MSVSVSARVRPAALRRRAGYAAAFERLEDRTLLAAIHWDGGGDGASWSDPANWSGDALPGMSDNILIGSDASVTIGGRSQRIRIASLESHGALNLRGGTIRAAEHLHLSGSLHVTGNATLRAGAELRFNASAAAAGHSLVFIAPDARFDSSSQLLDLHSLRIRAAKELWFEGQAKGSKLLLDGRGTARTVLTGTLDASTSGRRVPPGSVQVLGADIYLHNAVIDARGTHGAGEVRIGGDFAGGGTLPRAQRVYIDSDSRITANARRSGDGGTIIVWSDGHTIFEGLATATGGRRGGDGGFIETSAKGVLSVVNGQAVARGRAGESGLWLMDPYDVTIGAGANDNAAEIPGDPVTFLLFGANAFISAAAINTSLSNGTSVTVTTVGAGVQVGDLDVTAPITKTAGGNATLTLEASNNINVLSPITSTVGQLNLILRANTGSDDLDPNSGSVSIVGGNHNTNGGAMQFSGEGMTLNVFASLNTAGGTLTLNFAGGVSLDGSINAGSGVLNISSATANISADTTLNAGSATISAPSGFIQVTQLTTSIGSATIAAAGNLSLGSSAGGNFNIATTLTASAASSGTGTLTFGNFMSVNANTVQLRAGNGTGGPATASVNAISGNPVFRSSAGGATSPNSFELRQDASLLDANIPGTARFGSGTVPAVLSYRSDDGDLSISTAAKVAGAALTLGTSSDLSFGATAPAFAPASLAYSLTPGTIFLTGDVQTSAGNLTFPSNVTLETDSTVNSVGTVTFFGAVDGSSTLIVHSPGIKNFGSPVGASFVLDALTTTGGATQFSANVTAAAISLQTPVVTFGSLTIRADASGPSFSSTVNTGTGNLTIIGADPQFLGGSNSVTGFGVLAISPASNAVAIDIGGSTFLSAADVAALAPGFARIDFGSATHSAVLSVLVTTFQNNTRFLTGDGIITHQGITVTGGGGVAFEVSGFGQVSHLGTIETAGGPIVVDGRIIIDSGNARFSTTLDGAANGADITFTSTVTTGGEVFPILEMSGGATGIITLAQGLGEQSFPFQSLQVFGGPGGAIRSYGDIWLGDSGSEYLATETPFELGADITVSVSNATFLNGLRSVDTSRSLVISGSGDLEVHAIELENLVSTFIAGETRLVGNVNVSNSATVNGPVRITGIVTVTAQSLSLTGTVDLNELNLAIRADFLELGGNIFGGGGVSTLSIAPITLSQTISINDIDEGLWLSSIELSRIQEGLARLIIGHDDGTGTMYIGTAVFSDPVEFRMAGPGGEIVIGGYLRGIDNASFTFFGSGSTITINDYITTQSQPIVFNDAVEIGSFGDGPVLISTTESATPGAPITFNQTLDSVAGQANGLDLEAGIGDITFNGEVGGRPGGVLGYLYIDIGPGQTRLNGGLIRSVSDQSHNRAIVLGGDSVIEAGTATLYFYSQIICGVHDLLLRADDMEIFDLITGTGNLHISPFSLDRPMDVYISRLGPGDTLTIDPGEKDKIQDGFESVTYGQDGQMAALSVGGGEYSDPTDFVSNGEGEDSAVIIAGEVRGTDNGGIRIRGGGSTTHLFASILTQGNFIIIQDSVIVHVPGLMFDTTDGGAFPEGNEVEVQGPLDSEMGEGNEFAFQTGSGELRLMGPIGGLPGGRLGSLTLGGLGQTIVTGGFINTIGFQLYMGPVLVPVDLTISTIGAPITFEQQVDGEQNLTIDEGSGETTFEEQSSFDSLTIELGSTRTFNASVTIGTLTILGGTVFFNAPGLVSNGTLVSGVLSGGDNVSFDGQFSWQGGEVEGSGLLIILPGGVFALDAGTARTLSRNVEIRGLLHWIGGNLELDLASILVTTEGVLEVSSSGTMTAAPGSSGEVVNEGRIERTTPGAGAFVGLTVINTGVIDVADGAIKFTPVSGTFTNDGAILLGPAGSVIIRGEFVQAASGSLTIRIAGTGTAEFGRLLVINSALLDGSLTTEFVGGFAPQSGDELYFLTAESRTGAFLTQNIEQPAGSLVATVEYLPDGAALVISPLLTVDFNGDGERTVEDIFAFLSAWFAGDADFDGDGETSVADIFAYLSAWFAG